MIPTKYTGINFIVDSIERCTNVVKLTNMIYIVSIKVLVVPTHLVLENAAFNRVDSIWLLNNCAECITYWIAFYQKCLNLGILWLKLDSLSKCTM